jgi:zinc-ribbon domain
LRSPPGCGEKKGISMDETPARYCSNCGHELSPDDQFCPNCGRAVHETATVPTPEADVPVPPPPQAGAAAPAPQQAEGTQRSRSRRNLFLAGCLGLIGVLALLIIALIAAVALSSGGGGGGGDESAKKDKPPAVAPADEENKAADEENKAADKETSTVTMSDVRMATDENGEHPTTVFSPNDTIYCVGYLKNAPDDTKVTAVWVAADVKNIGPNSKIKQISAKGGSGLFRFNLSPVDSWPTGKYVVALYLNDEKEPTKALAFEVR